MMYKTIALQLLEQQADLYETLRQTRALPAALEACSTALRARHLELASHLSSARPNDHPDQLRNEAFEIAVRELEERLRFVSPKDVKLSLEQAMESLRNPA